MFGLLALRNSILTMDNLSRRGMIVVNCCPICIGDEESVDHLLLNRNVAQLIWRSVFASFGCSWVFPKCILELYQAWNLQNRSHKGKEMRRLSFLAVIWIIWKEKNSRLFEKRSENCDSVMEKIKFLVASWLLINHHFKGYSLDQIMRNLKEVA